MFTQIFKWFSHPTTHERMTESLENYNLYGKCGILLSYIYDVRQDCANRVYSTYVCTPRVYRIRWQCGKTSSLMSWHTNAIDIDIFFRNKSNIILIALRILTCSIQNITASNNAIIIVLLSCVMFYCRTGLHNRRFCKYCRPVHYHFFTRGNARALN